MTGLVGDAEIETTYAAVGRALSCWEEVEIGLAGLHSVFLGQPGELEIIRAYGQRNVTLSRRMAVLQGSADIYFRRRCSQDDEGEFVAISRRASELAESRHNLAHGVVQPMVWLADPARPDEWMPPVTLHVIGAPWYMSGKLEIVGGTGLGSYEIDLLGSRFLVLADQIHQFVSRLLAPTNIEK